MDELALNCGFQINTLILIIGRHAWLTVLFWNIKYFNMDALFFKSCYILVLAMFKKNTCLCGILYIMRHAYDFYRALNNALP